MLALVIALGLTAPAIYGLRGGFRGHGRGWAIVGFDPSALGLGALAIAAAVYFYGWEFGLALMLTVAVHEYGHVAAFRICGHTDAKFRLIPLFGGVAISNQTPASQEKSFFISLMGPAICLAPMCVAFTGAEVLADVSLPVAQFLYILGMVMGAINAFNLIPFYPLDGGKLVQILTYTYMPWATRNMSIVMSVAAALAAVYMQAFFLLIFVLIGWQNVLQSEQILRAQRPMGKMRGLWALAAYAATTGAFMVAGWPLLIGFVQ